MLDPYYPPGAFYFTVALLNRLGVASLLLDVDAGFQEVSGIQAQLEVETIAEGGENRFPYRLPRYVRYSNLVLKRGIVTLGSPLGIWMTTTFSAGLARYVVQEDLVVSLLDKSGIPLVAWAFMGAFPVRWEAGDLSSTDNKVLIETLEFTYNYYTRFPPG